MARIALFLIGQVCSLFVWVYIGPWLGAVLPESTHAVIAVTIGALAGTAIAVLAHWTRKPLLESPAWELTFRLVAWAGLLVWGVLEARYRNPVLGAGIVCAVIAAGGPALARHLTHAAHRPPRLRLDRRNRPQRPRLAANASR